MYEIKLLVTVQVDSDGALDVDESAEAAEEAISEALNYASNRGFNHSYSDFASIAFVSADVVE